MGWNIHRTVMLFFTINLMVVLFLLVSQSPSGQSFKQITNFEAKINPYRFDDPQTADLILKELDIYVPVNLGYTPLQAQTAFNKPLTGFKPDFEYCEKHREYLTQNPEFIFKEKNFLTTYWLNTNLRKKTIPALKGRDMFPKLSISAREYANLTVFDMGLDTTTFFFFHPAFETRQIGKQFSCLTQMSNHIPGHDNLARKDRIGNALFAYTKKYALRTKCFNLNKFFPKTWVMYDEEQCLDFFKEFNSRQYLKLKSERKIVYYKKIGVDSHRGGGVFPVNNEEEKKIRTFYKNGSLCGVKQNNYVMQASIYNGLMINNRKTDFRITIIIASTNPLMVYYHDGFMRVSMYEYDPNSKQKTALITNLNLLENVFKIAKENGTYNGKTEKQLQDESIWDFDRLQAYLLEEGMISDPNWLDNYFRPEVQRMIIHLIRMSQDSFAQRSSLFAHFGIDVMLDNDLNLWFIEANAKPAIEGYSDRAKQLFVEFLEDSFEVLYGLLRSRTKRIIGYVNALMQEGHAVRVSDKEVKIDDLDRRRFEFQELSKNRFEPEFKVKASNSMVKIIDENLSGPARYNYLIGEECF